MKKFVTFSAVMILSVVFSSRSFSHCEVPCGIYDDELRIALLYEHIVTIEKAMNQIAELTAMEDKNYNQIIRWVNTKEEHANEIQHIAGQYFITQRLKLPEITEGPEYEKYIKELTLMHQVIVYAMKSKQSTDTKFTVKLTGAVKAFEESYFEGVERHNPDGSHK